MGRGGAARRGAAHVLEIRISQIRGWLGTGVYRELGAQVCPNTHCK